MAVETITADITTLDVDVIVNAANESLSHGGGVAAAIARAGRPVVDQESEEWIRQHGPLGPGDAAHTGAGNMPARWVVHVVGPRFRPGQDNAGLLRQAVVAALERSADLGARSVALPAISAGIFGYPRPEATKVIADTVVAWTQAHPDRLDRVLLVGFDESTTEDFRRALEGADGQANS
jgi:putative ATPase